MSTYSESTGFWFNNRHSSEFGILNVHTQSGLFDEQFLPNRSVIEEKTFGRDEPYLMGFEYQVNSLPLTLYFEEGWDEYKLHEVVTWLVQPTYSPLIFDEDTSRIFYVAYEGDPRIFHNGVRQGYVTISMRCNSPFSFTPVEERKVTVGSTPVDIELYNIGHMKALPTVTIKKLGNGDVTITNVTDNNRQSKFTGLLNNETVTINSYHEDIATDVPNTYRYTSFNNNFPSLLIGINQVRIEGNCEITLTYQSKRYI